MPHQCTNCGRTFVDGSKEMLSGCPDCGGTKFQFSPDGFDDSVPETPPDPPDRPDDGMARSVGNAAATVRDIVSGSVGSDTTSASPPDQEGSVDADVPDGPPPAQADAGDDDIIVADSTPDEDSAQVDARSQLAREDDLPGSAGEPDDPTGSDGTDPVPSDAGSGDGTDAGDGTEPEENAPVRSDRTVATEPDGETADRPDLAQLRDELNDQFESIRIVERGQYELNLMELYDRDEVIVALQEDGRYSIRVPETLGETRV